jgi:hypothetical protein
MIVSGAPERSQGIYSTRSGTTRLLVLPLAKADVVLSPYKRNMADIDPSRCWLADLIFLFPQPAAHIGS